MISQVTKTDPATIASKFINHTNKCVFLTGKAGTGKTTFLRTIIQKTHKKAVVVAPTGIAAINAQGVTIHSQFQLPFGAFLPIENFPIGLNPNMGINTKQSLKSSVNMAGTKRRTLQSLELLIIDEVSMLRADVLDAIDTVLRSVRGNYFTPFGGVQVLFIGDLMQLPPVVKQDEWEVLKQFYDGQFFFHAKVLEEEKPIYIELEKIYRQDDLTFINILDNLRNNRINAGDMEILNKYYKHNFKPSAEDSYITLTTHNAKAAEQNQTALNELGTLPHTFNASIEGDFPTHIYPTDSDLVLKVGAQIIFIKNDPSGEKRFFNGKIAIIDSITEENGIEVRFKGESEKLTVERYEWHNIRYTVNDNTKEIEEEVIGQFTQYPIKLAWAITVHKSQGLTFERAIVDVSSAFAPGQVYVALSRLTSLEGLVLSSKIGFNGISSDSQVIRFASNKKEPDEVNGILEVETFLFLKEFLLKTFNFSRLFIVLKKHILSYDKSENKSIKQQYLDWANEQLEALLPMRQHADNFAIQLRRALETSPPQLTFVAQRLAAAKDYFSKTFQTTLINVRTHLEKMRAQAKTKMYQDELMELEAIIFEYLLGFQKSVVLVESILIGKEVTKTDFCTTNTEGGIYNILQQVQTQIKNQEPPQKPVKIKGETYLLTHQMFLEGKNPQSIAQERGLVEETIWSHLTKLTRQGKIDARMALNKEKFDSIADALKKFEGDSITDISHSILQNGYY